MRTGTTRDLKIWTHIRFKNSLHNLGLRRSSPCNTFHETLFIRRDGNWRDWELKFFIKIYQHFWLNEVITKHYEPYPCSSSFFNFRLVSGWDERWSLFLKLKTFFVFFKLLRLHTYARSINININNAGQNFQLIRHWKSDGICNLEQRSNFKSPSTIFDWLIRRKLFSTPGYAINTRNDFPIQFRFNSRWWKKKKNENIFVAKATKRKFMSGEGNGIFGNEKRHSRETEREKLSTV